MHLATLEVLDTIGIGITDAESQEIYAGLGCRVDKEKGIVQIPHYIVEDAAHRSPQCDVRRRNSDNDYLLKEKNVSVLQTSAKA